MQFRCQQSGITIQPTPVREIFTYSDRQSLQLGDTVTGSDGSRYLLLYLEAVTDTLSRLILVPVGVDQ